ncbi:MAG: Crp/Fnr family transcriptional regulator [Bacteroidales bacterium]|nr:Crp/Fnr family transcriptional regulator [Bacteroidales bacterium]
MAKPYISKECLEDFINLFEEHTFSEQEKKLLDANRSEVLFKKNEIITKQGSLATQIVFIKQGLTKSYFEYKNTRQTICMHPIHSLIGIQGLADSNIYHCTLSALNNVSVCMFDINTFRAIARQNARFLFQLLNLNIEHYSISIDRIFSLKLKEDKSKIADILLCLAQRVYASDTFDFMFSIDDLAELTDVKVKKAQKIWTEFEESKLIKLEAGRLKILDKTTLIEISA